MIFEQKIDNICSLIVSALSCETYNEEPALAKTISRVYELRGTVKKLFSKFLSDEFEEQALSIDDVKKSLCYFLLSIPTSKRDLTILNTFVRHLSIYRIDIEYIFNNHDDLVDMERCDGMELIITK